MSVWRGFVLGVTLSLIAAPAWAGRFNQHEHHRGGGGRGVPEIDPAGLGSAITLLAGGAFLVGARGRRRPKADKI